MRAAQTIKSYPPNNTTTPSGAAKPRRKGQIMRKLTNEEARSRSAPRFKDARPIEKLAENVYTEHTADRRSKRWIIRICYRP